jgi:hypothetical protein
VTLILAWQEPEILKQPFQTPKGWSNGDFRALKSRYTFKNNILRWIALARPF